LDATDYEIAIGQFQILHQHSENAANEALKDRASTLSLTDLITLSLLQGIEVPTAAKIPLSINTGASV
jgi:hypothetical protein